MSKQIPTNDTYHSIGARVQPSSAQARYAFLATNHINDDTVSINANPCNRHECTCMGTPNEIWCNAMGLQMLSWSTRMTHDCEYQQTLRSKLGLQLTLLRSHSGNPGTVAIPVLGNVDVQTLTWHAPIKRGQQRQPSTMLAD